MSNTLDDGAGDAADARSMEPFERLAGGIAHDFNNFLTAILSTADLALSSPGLAPEVRADLESIRESGKRAAATVRQLLMFSRNQVGQPRPTDLNALVSRMEPMLRRLTPATISLDVKRDARGLTAVDPAQIDHVLVALVRNAIEAMPNGGSIAIDTADLTIHKAMQHDGRAMLAGPYVVLRVRDTGVGMDDATLKHIFEPYFTTKSRATEQGSGAGLGLAAVHGIVQKAGGHIMVRSRPGEGTVVEVCLPGADPTAIAGTSSTIGIAVGGGEVLLVIEHEAAVRAPVCRALRQLGYYVLEAATADDALNVLQEYHAPAHLLIVDIASPQVNAPELVGLLQSWYPSLRVLYVSGGDGDPGAAGLPPGARIVHKPFTAKRLALLVRAVLDDREREDAG